MERNDTVMSTGGQSAQTSQQAADQYGVPNLEYDIITTMSNLLQGQEVLARYAADADQAGDTDVATIFRTLQENNRSTAQQLRNALARFVDVSTNR
jgi:hypothetical protein